MAELENEKINPPALEREKIKKLETGELIGNIASVFCGAVFVYFVVMVSIAWAKNDDFLKIIMWATAPALMVVGIFVSAFCNLKYGKPLEKAIKKYVVAVFVENAANMHPEKDSLTFYIKEEEKSVAVTVNNYKDRIVFDFSAIRFYGATRRISVMKIIADRLAATFCRLYERGGRYKSITYTRADKSGKSVAVISNGVPDKKIMKNYLRNR